MKTPNPTLLSSFAPSVSVMVVVLVVVWIFGFVPL